MKFKKSPSWRVATKGLLLFLALGIPVGLASPAWSGVIGHAVVAKPGGDALLVWDASAEITRFVNAKMPNDRIADRLDHDALSVAAQNFGKIERSAKSISVRIVYIVSAGMSPAYHADTFGHMERYALLTMPYRDAAANRDHWKTLAPNARLPGWVKVSVTGALPPK